MRTPQRTASIRIAGRIVARPAVNEADDDDQQRQVIVNLSQRIAPLLPFSPCPFFLTFAMGGRANAS